MSGLAPIVLAGWFPIVAALVARLPVGRAVIASVVLGWLFLPEASYPVAGPLPDVSKITVTCLSPFVAAAALDGRRFWSLRPRWIDVPMIVWCASPFASSLANGLGAYDGISAALEHTIKWGVPYALGRLYCAGFADLRELAVAVFIGGVLYMPFCLFESVAGPRLHELVYGWQTRSLEGPRFWGWRPVVFMHGLTVALWLMAASLSGAWLSLTGSLRRFAGIGTVWWVAALAVTTVLARSLNAWLLLLLGCAALWPLRPRAARRARLPEWLPLACLLAIPSAYITARATGAWTGRALIPIVRTFSPARGESIEYRIQSEIRLTVKANERPALGWGRWSRAEVTPGEGVTGAIRDSLWIIALGDGGWIALISVVIAMLLPSLVLWSCIPPTEWSRPVIAPAAVLAIIVALYAVDNCFNAMINPVYMLAAGGLTGLAETPRPSHSVS